MAASQRIATTHTLIEHKLVVYKRERSAVWQCRFSIDNRWQRTSTGERDLAAAKARAHELLVEANVKKQLSYAPITRRFKDVAAVVVKKLKAAIEAGEAKAIYKDYVSAIERYFIPALGKFAVNNIDYKALEVLDEYRLKHMKGAPTRSTLLNHNAALKLIFDEAIYRNYMVELNRPVLVAKGKASKRRPAFTLREVRALRNNFDAWIAAGKADSIELRALLRDYVEVLLDTGARPGRELLELKWTQIEHKYFPSYAKTGEIEPPSEWDDEGVEITTGSGNSTAILNIQDSKTGPRLAIGRLPTVQALKRIAERNYKIDLKELLKKQCPDYVFTYREYISARVASVSALTRDPALIRPTSFSKLFDTYLETHNLAIDPITKQSRVLYSLRHTHATLALTHDKVSPHTLAKQMGTSIGMLEKHYSHLDAVKAVHQLRGEESRQLIEAYADHEDDLYKATLPSKAKKSAKNNATS